MEAPPLTLLGNPCNNLRQLCTKTAPCLLHLQEVYRSQTKSRMHLKTGDWCSWATSLRLSLTSRCISVRGRTVCAHRLAAAGKLLAHEKANKEAAWQASPFVLPR